MSLRLRAFPDRGFLVWFALSAGVVAWAAHLLFLASFVEFMRDHGFEWVAHLATAVAVAVTVTAMLLSARMLERGHDDEEQATPSGRTRFLGMMGLWIGGISLALILAEGVYVVVLGPHV
jgi:hypothetical protein